MSPRVGLNRLTCVQIDQRFGLFMWSSDMFPLPSVCICYFDIILLNTQMSPVFHPSAQA